MASFLNSLKDTYLAPSCPQLRPMRDLSILFDHLETYKSFSFTCSQRIFVLCLAECKPFPTTAFTQKHALTLRDSHTYQASLPLEPQVPVTGQFTSVQLPNLRTLTNVLPKLKHATGKPPLHSSKLTLATWSLWRLTDPLV